MRKLLVLLLLISFLLQAGQWHASATSLATTPARVADEPTPSPTPTPTPDAELDEKTRAAALAEAEKNRAVSEQQAAEARLAKLKAETAPLGDATKVTIPTGSVTTDEGGFVEVEMLSQEAARAISNKVMKKLCGAKIGEKNIEIGTLVIYDSSEVAALELYSSVSKQLESFLLEFGQKHKEKEDLLKETDLEAAPPNATDFPGAFIAAPGVATGLIKSVAELINLFRTDTEFKNKKVAIPEDMVVSYLISYIQTKGCTKKPVVYYPHFYPPNLVTGAKDSDMIKLLKTTGEAKGTAVEDIKAITKRIEEINTLVAKLTLVKETPGEIAKKEEAKKKCNKDKKCIEALEKEIEALKNASDEANKKINELTNNKPAHFIEIVKNKTHEKWLTKLNRLKSLTQFLIDSADLVTTKLNTPDDTTKLTAMSQLLRAERLREILKEDSAFTLRIAVTANGTTKIKKNMFVDAKVRHTAGANLVYQLFDHDGRVVRGDALQFYFDYMSARDVRNTVSTDNEEEDEIKEEKKDAKKKP